MNENTTPVEPGIEQPKAVFPTEAEVMLSVVAHYQQQVDEITKKTEEALGKLRKELEHAQANMIALAAQKKLLETLGNEFQKIKGK